MADFGDWTEVVRELADHDYGRYAAVTRWPLREALLSLAAKLKAKALEAYRHEFLVWALTAPHAKKPSDPPKPPDILKN